MPVDSKLFSELLKKTFQSIGQKNMKNYFKTLKSEKFILTVSNAMYLFNIHANFCEHGTESILVHFHGIKKE